MQQLSVLCECARAARGAEGASTAKATAAAKPKAKAKATAAAAKPNADAKTTAAAKPKAKASRGKAQRVVDSSDEEEEAQRVVDSSDEEEERGGKSINEMTVDEALEAAGMREWTSSSAKRTSHAKEKRTPVVNVDCDIRGEDSDSEDNVPLAERKRKK